MLSDAGWSTHARPARGRRAAVERLERRGREGYGMSYEIAIIRAALGQLDEACTALREHPTIIHKRSGGYDRIRGWIRCGRRSCYTEVTQRLLQVAGLFTGSHRNS